MRLRGLLVLFGILLAVVASEVVLRIGARFSFAVAMLTGAGSGDNPPIVRDFEDFLRARPSHLRPHWNWFGYWTNALGFNDREFAPAAEPGTTRIMALGDSYCFGTVAYPDNVMTQLEGELGMRCGNERYEVLNFGVPGTGVWDYLTVLETAGSIYRPHVVIVHFYLGNDAPDLLTRFSDVPQFRSSGSKLFLPAFLSNAAKLLRSVDRSALARLHALDEAAAEQRVGGARASASGSLDPDLLPAPFTPEGEQEVLALELTRFFAAVAPSAGMKDPWKRVLDVLDRIARRTEAIGAKLIVVLYPSRVQLYSSTIDQLRSWSRGRAPFGALENAAIDLELPARQVQDFCRSRGVTCFDLTAPFTQRVAAEQASVYRVGDTHWNRLGNRIAAEIEGEFLTTELCEGSGGR